MLSYKGNYPPSYKNQPAEIREKAVELANGLLQDGAEEEIAIATGLKQARELFKNHHSTTLKTEIMDNNNNHQQANNDQEDTNQNANSAYSGSGSMQPGGSTGEQGKLSDYDDDEKETNQNMDNTDAKSNTGGKSISEATDPSKLSDL